MDIKIIQKHIALLSVLLISTFICSEMALAHGEKAQQAGLRMRTLNWFDTEIYPRKVSVNDTVTIKGKFMPSKDWPRHMESIEGTAFLNIGVPGPAFIRTDSHVNGVTMIRSTAFELGKLYEYDVTLKARTPGRYHVHPLISVKGTGPIIGPAFWVEVTGDQADFENTFTTLTGKVVNPETYGIKASIALHAVWFVLGVLWIAYWFRNARKDPVIMPRFKKIEKLGQENADQLITTQDLVVGASTFMLILTFVAAGYFITEYRIPQTVPLQTGIIKVPPMENPNDGLLDIVVKTAEYRIPGRSFNVEMEITNKTDKPLSIGEFSTSNVRFINSKVKEVLAQDTHDLVASDGLRVPNNVIPAGETVTITMYAEDALWETQRLTSLVYDPDSFFGGLLFLYDDEGKRYYKEISGLIIPSFV